MEITTDNELIAEFMGAVRSQDYGICGWRIYYLNTNDPKPTDEREMMYGKSWDWLMPVVDKIEEIALNVSIETACVTIEVMDDAYPVYRKTITFEWQEDTKLNVLFRAVIEFIKWYNNHGKQDRQTLLA